MFILCKVPSLMQIRTYIWHPHYFTQSHIKGLYIICMIPKSRPKINRASRIHLRSWSNKRYYVCLINYIFIYSTIFNDIFIRGNKFGVPTILHRMTVIKGQKCVTSLYGTGEFCRFWLTVIKGQKCVTSLYGTGEFCRFWLTVIKAQKCVTSLYRTGEFSRILIHREVISDRHVTDNCYLAHQYSALEKKPYEERQSIIRYNYLIYLFSH